VKNICQFWKGSTAPAELRSSKGKGERATKKERDRDRERESEKEKCSTY